MPDEVMQIAGRIKDIREATGLTPQEVANTIGMDADLYLRYESGEEDMPIGFLTRFSDSFSIPLTSLLSGEEPKLSHYFITRHGKGIEVQRHPGYVYQALAHRFMNKKCEPFYVTVEPGMGDAKLNAHMGQELDYVLEGKLKVIVGEQELILEKGDCIYLDSAYMHGLQALEDEPASFLAIVLK
ncbi:XRE family transcriptional regulator [Christensenella sp. MSJ-20]|uniref:helix-turn-helix domain-containing protein n=1 Tax=Christensenella sp. MSJ-20 TaxID=2841518 RepID=UPI000D7A1CF7|nr:MAG: transcriptional regulator [Bacillota bacterium]QWT55297.1 XRE family transcriptional regulator [Christensenella sp. MSJ-20]